MTLAISIDDITSKDIKQNCISTPLYIDRANRMYEQMISDFGLDPEKTYPIKGIIKDHLLNYLGILVHTDLMGYSYQSAANGVTVDPHEAKLNSYRSLYKESLQRINREVLEGVTEISRGLNSGVIRRG